MQSSLAIVLSLTLGFSPHPCVSIFGTGHIYLTLETFLGSSSTAFRTRRSFPYASRLLVSDGGFACHPDISLAPALPAAGCSFLSPSFLHIYTGTGISTCCPSTTPFGLALGPDLPRADEPSSGNLGFRCVGFSPTFRYSHRHSLFHDLHTSFRSYFSVHGTLPYHPLGSIASVVCLAPVNYRRRVIRLVSCYALFKGWLLLSQPPSCLYISTSFST